MTTASAPDLPESDSGLGEDTPSAASRSPGTWVRIVIRSLAMVGWTGLLFGLWGFVAMLLLPFPRGFARWRAVVVQILARGMCRLLGIRRLVEGRHPPPPFLLASNHLSYVDILVLAASVRGVFVSKREVQDWPGIGFLASAFGTIYLDRTRKRDTIRVLEQIDRRVDDGVGVVLFPEGTSSPGDRVYPFHPALFEWAARRRFPVHTVALSYATSPPDPPAHLSVCWWGRMTFVPHLTNLVGLRRTVATIRFGDEPLLGDHRRDLARRIEHAVLRQFIPVVDREQL